MSQKTTVRRCHCHSVDDHRCPALTKLRNFAIKSGRCHLAEGRLVPGPAPVKPSKPRDRKSTRGRRKPATT